MCTVTIRRDARGVLLTMNRDERVDRAPERAPLLMSAGGETWAGPLDGEAGGTWLGVNAHGLAAALLNGYQAGDDRRPADAPSRGGIIPLLLGRGVPDAAHEWLRAEFDPRPYASFDLLLAWPGGGVRHTWRGERLTCTELDAPWAVFSSSSWRTAEVLGWRRERFAAWLNEGARFAGELPEYHLLHPAGREAWAPLMTRPSSHTRSITQVRVDAAAGEIRLNYWSRPGAGGAMPAQPDVTLRLEHAAATPDSRAGCE